MVISAYVGYLSYVKHTDTSITKLDWVFFIIAMSSLPIWYVTEDPLAAVIILTSADLLAFVPTITQKLLLAP